MDIEIRTITEQEIPAYGRSLERAFSEHWTEQDWKVEHNVFEVERSLAAFDARKSQVVELRYFGGLTVEEAAEVLSVSPETVARDWRLARTWLLRELSRK